MDKLHEDKKQEVRGKIFSCFLPFESIRAIRILV